MRKMFIHMQCIYLFTSKYKHLACPILFLLTVCFSAKYLSRWEKKHYFYVYI